MPFFNYITNLAQRGGEAKIFQTQNLSIINW